MVNNKCSFSGKLCLTVDNVQKDLAQRETLKAAMNSLVGRLGMRPNFNQVHYLYSYAELVDLFYQKDVTITDICLLDNEVARVVTENVSCQGNKSTNVVISAYVTSLSR